MRGEFDEDQKELRRDVDQLKAFESDAEKNLTELSEQLQALTARVTVNEKSCK